jgi:hypothetical protein
MEQIWNTYNKIECVADDASKIQDIDEYLGFQKPLQSKHQVTLKSNCTLYCRLCPLPHNAHFMAEIDQGKYEILSDGLKPMKNSMRR